MSNTNIKEDFLETDQPIPGQNYVCLSFVSPEKVLKQKDAFLMKKFLQNVLNDKVKRDYLLNLEENQLTYEKVNDLLEDFKIVNEKEIQDEFDKIVDFQTNVRGIKIRGVYNTLKEAKIRAERLRKIDDSFHVFVGQVGYWLPWDPSTYTDEIDQEYQERQLNELMKNYKINAENRDMFYEEEKRNRVEKAREENERKKKENIEKGVIKEDNKNKEISKEERDKFREIVDEKDRIFNEMKTQKQNSNDDDPLNENTGYSDPWMQRMVEGTEPLPPPSENKSNQTMVHSAEDPTASEQDTNISQVIKEIF